MKVALLILNTLWLFCCFYGFYKIGVSRGKLIGFKEAGEVYTKHIVARDNIIETWVNAYEKLKNQINDEGEDWKKGLVK